MRSARYDLYEPRNPQQASQIWQAHVSSEDLEDECRPFFQLGLDEDGEAAPLPPVAQTLRDSTHKAQLPRAIAELQHAVHETQFWREQENSEMLMQQWQHYVDIFIATHGRAPVLYDLYCGEGGMSRGARAGGGLCWVR